ncbi:SAV_2336 N-terminal domain-related protein [Streptomyces sp. SP18CS02]|uniref:SAV_2336 N-terminal domain-related protein n=1 Tax=Streptomyces sp. SP18CS02 TaxID=3002531 RepID=UPI002E77C35D|nr:SAV_2336 N-terminal domain-related protein [Streptomyces sp. SP18CS02]MEE1757254.1 SAV_2336 N-terminal domain-related protein [Streptomyces sp. SP18CS02]
MTTVSPHAPGFLSGPLTELVARLREAELGPTAEEVADALWLAQWVTPAGPPVSAHHTGAALPDPLPGPSGADGPPQPPPRRPGPRGGPAREGRAGLSAPGCAGAQGEAADSDARVWVPTADTLPDPQALQRALRPLQRYRAPGAPVRRVIDERATADAAADSGLTVPVLRRERRREARVQLLMDVSSSTVVWHQTLDELRGVCERAGAFRTVDLLYLHTAPDGRPGIATTAARGTAPLHSPAQLADPTGRRLTLLLSDCAGPLWRSGELHRLLHRWAATAPVAVVQPLPQRMWRNAHLPAFPGLLRRPEGPAARLEFTGRALPPRGAAAIPVLAPNRVALETWARLLSAPGRLTLPGAAGWAVADPPPARPAAAGPTTPPTAAERVRAFRRHASPSAVRLAECLSLAPLVLPVMQLVQRAMLTGSGPDVLAEVLLSGLLKRSDDETDDVTEPVYDFLPGVQEELWTRLEPGDAHLVLKNCSQYLERRFGTGVRNFPAMAAAYLAGTVEPQSGPDDPRLRRFAVVSTQVLRHFLAPAPAVPAAPDAGPADLAALARESLERFRSQGTARDLDAAVDLLAAAAHGAGDRTRQAALQDELAQALLERWEARRLGEDLRGALAAAELAAPDEPGAYWTLSQVLDRMADEVRAAGPGTDAVPERFRQQAARGIDGGGTDPEAIRFLLLVYADERLSRAPAGGGENHNRMRLNHVHVLLMLATEYGDYAARLLSPPPEDPERWYGAMGGRAVRVLDSLVDADPTPSLLHMRGVMTFLVARSHALSGHAAPEQVRSLARRASEDLAESLALLEAVEPAEREERGTPDDDPWGWTPAPRDLFLGWTRAASAIELAEDAGDGREAGLRVLAALEEARAIAERYLPWPDRDEQLADCLLRIGRLRLSLHGTGELDDIVELLARAVRLTPLGAPRHVETLSTYASTVLLREPARPHEVEAVVRLHREAVDATPESSADLAVYRLQLGQALLKRFQLRGALTDLHEADWILGAVARGTDSRELSALAWMFRGLVSHELGRTTGATVRYTEAGDHYRRAVDDAVGTGNTTLAATATRSRAKLLERTAGAPRALAEYRKALRLLTEAGASGSAETDALRRDIARLEAEEA